MCLLLDPSHPIETDLVLVWQRSDTPIGLEAIMPVPRELLRPELLNASPDEINSMHIPARSHQQSLTSSDLARPFPLRCRSLFAYPYFYRICTYRFSSLHLIQRWQVQLQYRLYSTTNSIICCNIMAGYMTQAPPTHESRTATVPIYLSTTHSRSGSAHSGRSDRSGRSHGSGRSRPRHHRPLFNEHLDGDPNHPNRTVSPAEQSDMYGSRTGSGQRYASSSSSHAYPRKHISKRRKISRSTLLRRHIGSKFRLAVCFGVTALIAVIVTIALFASHAMGGTLSLVLAGTTIFTLLAVFAHSLVRYFMLKGELRRHTEKIGLKKKSPSYRGWNISRPLPTTTANADGWYGQTEMEPPREGMRVYMNEDLEANYPNAEQGADNDNDHDTDHENEQNTTHEHEHEAQRSDQEQSNIHPGANIAPMPPPPIYGNFRNSIVSPPPRITPTVATWARRPTNIFFPL